MHGAWVSAFPRAVLGYLQRLKLSFNRGDICVDQVIEWSWRAPGFSDLGEPGTLEDLDSEIQNLAQPALNHGSRAR